MTPMTPMTPPPTSRPRALPSLLALAVAGLAWTAPAAAQAPEASLFTPDLERHPGVIQAAEILERDFDRQVQEWIQLTEIPAPSGHEAERAAFLQREFEALGLEVTIDSIGNVTARRPGVGGGPTLVYAAHMDTVFPLGTDITVRIHGDTLRAPGISDDTNELAAMLALARAMDEAGIQTRGDILFVGTVQEEVGLKGMTYWLDTNPEPDMLVALDSGLGGVSYGALGIYWTRYFFRGEAAHTLGSAGRPHPARALSRAILSIYEMELPTGPDGAVMNVGMLEGGQIFNAIPAEVSFTVDLRSVDPELLDPLNEEIEARVAAAAEAEGVDWALEAVNRTPAGGTEASLADRRRHPLVETALHVHEHLGFEARASASGATDANVAVARGIPAIATGTGRGGNAHTLQEWAYVPIQREGMRMLLLLTVSLAGLAGPAT
jgi:tripeptide aminopeptidase